MATPAYSLASAKNKKDRGAETTENTQAGPQISSPGIDGRWAIIGIWSENYLRKLRFFRECPFSEVQHIRQIWRWFSPLVQLESNFEIVLFSIFF